MLHQVAEEVAVVDPQVVEVAPGLPPKQSIELKLIEDLERRMLEEPQLDIPPDHFFAPDVYLRQVTMPSGSLIVGHEHKTEHFNFVLSGRATIFVGGKSQEVVGPCIFKSAANTRKVGYIHETMTFVTVHSTQETNIEKLEDELFIKSSSFKQYELNTAKAKELMDSQNGGGK
jgi:quercetin dioxygenase-like cupin family protein